MSERTSVGGSSFCSGKISGQRHANIVNPVVTLHTQLRREPHADAGVGVMVVQQPQRWRQQYLRDPVVLGLDLQHNDAQQLLRACVRDAASALNSGISTSGGQTTITTTGR